MSILKPNDLPLICLPTELDDHTAAAFVEFLHEITEAFERHYFAQLRRHYQQHYDRPCEPERDNDHRDDDQVDQHNDADDRVLRSEDPPF